MSEAMGYKCFLTVGGSYIEFLSEDLAENIQIVEDEGIRGTRSHVLERVAQGNKLVQGSILIEPTPAEMAILLPLVTGSSTSATTLTDALSDVTIICDLITDKYTFSGRFTAMHLSGEPGKKLRMKLDCIGYSLSIAATSLSGVPDITVRPYMMYDLGSGLTIASTAYPIDRFELTIDNKIVPTFMQGQTATDLEPTDREVWLSMQCKYTSTEKGLLTVARTGPVIASPLTASLAFTNGSNSMTFTFGALVAQSKSVTIPGKQHLRLPLRYRAYQVSTTKEVVPVLV